METAKQTVAVTAVEFLQSDKHTEKCETGECSASTGLAPSFVGVVFLI